MNKLHLLCGAVVAMALAAGCNGSATRYEALIEVPDVEQEEVQMCSEAESVALWGETSDVLAAHLETAKDGRMYACYDDTAALGGTLHWMVPAEALTADGYVMLPAEQNGALETTLMPYYAENPAKSKEAAFKTVGGLLKLHFVTHEKVAEIEIATADSNRFIAGAFAISNYPYPVLTPTEQSVRLLRLTGASTMDFSQGGDLCACIAPGCYKTLSITLRLEDGRTCVKELPEDAFVTIDRNKMFTITLGRDGAELVFE